ncbi:MAG: twin-arginine translocase TatA/TatE family subunit [Erythrobacter sp.]|nr:twin-arginine translocase TatA/TatE family subunit [Erythrobacter sp.]
MSLGPWQLIIIALVILVLFGRGKISEMMGDFGKGIKSFKEGMNEEDAPSARRDSPRIEGPAHDAKPASETVRDDKAPTPSDRT